MTSSVHAPELAPPQGLEVPFDGIEPDRDDPIHLPDSRSTTEKEARAPVNRTVKISRMPRSRWILRACIVVIAIIAVTVGTIEGVGRSRSLPNSPTSNSTVDLSQRILLDTSIASAICPTGDRWVLLQDQQNNIRVALQKPQSTWQFFPNMTIPATARPRSPLSASCVAMTSSSLETFYSDLITTGSLVSIIFLDKFERLGQSYFNDGSWHSVSTQQDNQAVVPWLDRFPGASSLPPSIPASANSRLSISTMLLPAIVDNGSIFSTPNNSFIAPRDLLSSVAIYQANDTPVMVDLIGSTQMTNTNNSRIDNLFSQFQFFSQLGPSLNSSAGCGVTNALKPYSSGGFACMYNAIWNEYGYSPIPCSPQNKQTSSGNRISLCVSPGLTAIASYEPYMLGYNDSQVVGYYNTERADQSSSSIFDSVGNLLAGTTSNNTDLNIVPLPEFQFAVTYLSVTGNIMIGSLFSTLSANWSDQIPFGHISSCSDGNSSIVYTYYQENETTMAEVAFDSDDGSWSPTYFHIDASTD